MRRSDEFRRAVRRGARAGNRHVVVHLLDAPADPTVAADAAAPCRVGFVVGRGVGGSVVRSQVTRRLRHLVRDRLDRLPDGGLLVVRAQHGAAAAPSVVLGAELDRALARVLPPTGLAA
jgi:ribonuclease P protein component